MLRPWSMRIMIDKTAKIPAARQIVHSVIEEVRRGRLDPGSPLPGSRDLADSLQVNRKTVVHAYTELAAQGWVATESRRGTFVVDDLPLLKASGSRAATRMPAAPSFSLPAAGPTLGTQLPSGESLAFNDGAPDIRQVPVDVIARAYRTALRSTAHGLRLGYGDPRGSEILRASISEMLNTSRGLSTTAENICVTRGSQMGIFVIAQTLIAPGDTVVVEALTYPPAREAFRKAGARIASVSVDADGLRVDELEDLCRRGPVRAIYVTPHHHFPTTVLMKPERRMRLMLLAAQFGFAVIEDDYDHEFNFTHQPMLPLASFDRSGNVIYIGSFSKLLSPSLRIGYLSAPRAVIEKVAAEIMLIDRQGDPALEAAVASMIEEGELHRHIRKVMRLYAERRGCFERYLHEYLGDRVTFVVPDGGLAFWVRFAGVDVEQLKVRCHERNLFVQSPAAFAMQPMNVSALRLGFAGLTREELKEATLRLRAAFCAQAD